MSFFSYEGDDAEAFFVLTSGRVKLTQLTPEGHQVVLRIIGAGNAFGGAGVFGDLTYPVGAEAVEPAVALVWTSGIMRRLLETEPRSPSTPCNSSPGDCMTCSVATANS